MAEETETQPQEAVATEEAPVKRRRGRPRKKPVEETPTPEVTEGDQAPAAGEEAPVKRRRGRPRKKRPGEEQSQQATPDIEAMTKTTQESTQASSVPGEPPTMTLDGSDATAAPVPRRRGRPRKHPLPELVAAPEDTEGSQDVAADASSQQEGEGNAPVQEQHAEPQPRGRRSRRDHEGFRRDDRPGQRGRNRRNRRGGPAQNVEPSLSREELQAMRVAELRSKAAELEVEYLGLKKAALVEAIYVAAARAEGFRRVEGVLELQSEGYGFLRTGNYMKGESDAFVHQQLIRQYGLRAGDCVSGSIAPARNNSKYPPLHKVGAVNGRDPEEGKGRPRFRDLTPIFPNERLVMEHGRDSITGRAIDLVAPIGKGQRGLIVSPPKAGKTTVLKHICQSIAVNNPEVHLFCLLVDERPEEVTDMERSIKGEVVASTFDMPASNHTAVSELVIEHAKRLVEMGEDVVVVLDSITRLARAYNLAQPPSGRILSGGVDSAALYPPKKFLGAARNIEGGGSLTILASALVDTGSKMDEVIFEEFKGTGNMELKLDRDLADRRIFPAIDPIASGTRNEELLIDPELQPFVWGIRRILANMSNTERAATALISGLKKTNDNQEFLIRSAKKAQQSEYLA